ncbi:hypothetical protein [Streptomyces sp. KLOTTS4A1]|uniref:hypothetical protein n=1 Tax=Streptomyces sp. KLOTTS4A1 TaxID=3390996 RepID=UPI0039F52BC5
MSSDRFEELFDLGRGAILARRVPGQVPPGDGDSRWGLTVLLRPDETAAGHMERLTKEAMAVAGAAHWPTGDAVSSHFTIRTLERHRTHIPAGDEAVERYQAALHAASKQTGAIRLRLTGLTLTPGSVMLCARPMDASIDRFARALADALGGDAWFEADLHRTIWYSNLVHFTEPPQGPEALLAWVAARRRLELGVTMHTQAELVAWKFTGRRVIPRVLAAAELQHARPAESIRQ